MKDQQVAHILAVVSAHIGLSVSAFLLCASIVTVGVQVQGYAMQYMGPQVAAAATGIVAGATTANYTMCDTISPGAMNHEIGNAYQVLSFVSGGDSSQTPSTSTIMVFENGIAMGPAHSIHQAIRDSGAGRFSHWVKYLYFSSSDNSNPMTNGRTYAYGVPQGSLCPVPLPSGKDQTASLQHWIDSLPDGATLSFPASSTYMVNERLFLVGRSNLTFEGNGTTLLSATSSRNNASMVEFSKGTNIVMRNMTLDGGRPSGTYDPLHEAEFAIGARGVNGLELDRMRIQNTGGDCALIDAYNGVPLGPQSSSVYIHDSNCTNAGRMGVALTGVASTSILRNTFKNVAIHVVDCEPDYPAFGCQNLRIDSNTALSYGAGSRFAGWFFVAAVNSSAMSDLSVTNNAVYGTSTYFIEVYKPLAATSTWKNVTITGNRADRPGSQIVVRHVSNVVIASNTNATVTTEDIGAGSYAACGAIATASLRGMGGNSYLLEKFAYGGDTLGGISSDVVVMENGIVLGPGHSAHADILANGAGRFSHWYTNLYFSSSDNSNPKTNGRTYSYGVPTGKTCPMPAPQSYTTCGTINKAAAYQQSGNAYLLPFVGGGDTSSAPASSKVIVLDNGNLVGPPHSIHADIRTKGAGRYSHWATYLYFSSLDNSNPLTNGRTYTWAVPTGETCPV